MHTWFLRLEGGLFCTEESSDVVSSSLLRASRTLLLEDSKTNDCNSFSVVALCPQKQVYSAAHEGAV